MVEGQGEEGGEEGGWDTGTRGPWDRESRRGKAEEKPRGRPKGAGPAELFNFSTFQLRNGRSAAAWEKKVSLRAEWD